MNKCNLFCQAGQLHIRGNILAKGGKRCKEICHIGYFQAPHPSVPHLILHTSIDSKYTSQRQALALGRAI